jgi:4-hydroxy-tetrahydrodipicolinate reductase
MGQALAAGLGSLERFSIAALVDEREPADVYGAVYVDSLTKLDASSIDAVVDFSSPASAVLSAQWCGANGVALVLGTTGLSSEQRSAVEKAGTQVGVVLAANFAIGAVLSERFAAQAAPYFDRVEIIELHHDKKVDAPSGTSIVSAHAIADARKNAGLESLNDPTTRETVAKARGADVVDGIKIHSVRLPGLVAHQEVLFGSEGEGLTIRHDSFGRGSFVHGVALALDAVDSTPRFLDGISSLVL